MTQPETASSSPAGRLSAIELLRLLSMLMVLILHADYVALRVPDAALFATTPAEAVGRVVAEQLSIVAVDVFVLISAWFGIRTTVRGICSLLFQVLFYALVILGALSQLLAFASDTRRRNRLINTLAASSLAVYLIHFNPFLFKHYQQICRQLYYSYDGIMVWLAMGSFLLTVFFGSILIDRLRLPLWQLLLRAFSRRSDRRSDTKIGKRVS